MNSKASIENLNKQIDAIVNRVDFPYEIPISLGDTKLGTLKISFEACKEETPEKNWDKKVQYLKGLMNDLKLYIDFFKLNLYRNLKLNLKYADLVNQSSALSAIIFIANPRKTIEIFKRYPSTNLGRMIYAYEGGLFKLIRDEGPGILCNPDALNRLEDLISDEELAGVMINSLRDSLLEYAYQKPLENLPSFPMGRQERELVKRIGDDTIRKLYEWLRSLFKFVKFKYFEARSEKITAKNIFALIVAWEKENIDGLFDIAREEQPEFYNNPKAEAMVKRANLYSLEKLLFVIRDDKRIYREFLEFSWQPHEFAKKVLAKLLNISVSKLTKIIYKPRKT